MITFGDSANAHLLIDAYSHVALYSGDCDYPCPPEVAAHWDETQKRWITFRGNPDASIIDYEPLTRDYQDPALLRNWLEARNRMKSTRIPWIYSDLDNAATAAFYARGLVFNWWVATLDGVRRTPAQLADLLVAWDVPEELAEPRLVAANQWRQLHIKTPDASGEADESVCFVNRDW